MNPWLLLLIPPWIFLVAALARWVLIWTQDAEEWWSFPLYIAVGVPLLFAGVAGVLLLGACAFGLFPQTGAPIYR